MIITATLFKKSYDGERAFISLSDIPTQFLVPENDIMIHVEQGENDSNGWNEGHTTLVISKQREQTEEEKKVFKEHFAKLKAESKQKRREEYLKLKTEFEDEKI